MPPFGPIGPRSCLLAHFGLLGPPGRGPPPGGGPPRGPPPGPPPRPGPPPGAPPPGTPPLGGPSGGPKMARKCQKSRICPYRPLINYKIGRMPTKTLGGLRPIFQSFALFFALLAWDGAKKRHFSLTLSCAKPPGAKNSGFFSPPGRAPPGGEITKQVISQG